MDLVVDGSSPAGQDDLTMVMPTRGIRQYDSHEQTVHNRPGPSKTISTDQWNGPYNEDDGFTMVMPNTQTAPFRSRSHIPSPQRVQQSPERALNNCILSNSPRDSPSRIDQPSEEASHPSSRRGSPMRQAEEVQVFEDEPNYKSRTAATKSDQSSPEKTPLEELPINDQGYGRSPTPENASKASSPHTLDRNGNGFAVQTSQDRAETLRARRLLMSGIERIKAHTLDAHGFRKLQELVKSPNADIWIPFTTPAERESHTPTGDVDTSSPARSSTNKLADLLFALTSYVEAPLSSVSTHPAKATNLKSQALAMTTSLLVQPHASYPASGYAQVSPSRKSSQAMCPRALCALLHARQQCDDVSHLAAELERSATELVTVCQPVAGIEAILGVLDAEESSGIRENQFREGIDANAKKEHEVKSDSTRHSRLISMGLDILSQLLRRLKPRENGDSRDQSILSAGHRRKLGEIAVKFLEDPEPDVRRADTDFCVELYDVISRRKGGPDEMNGNGTSAEEFWKVVESAGEGSLNLITYYLAKRGKA